MKYIVIDQTKTDWFTTEFDNKEDAIKEADYQFSKLTKNDLKRREDFYVLESVNPDEYADNHFDGNVIKKYL